MNLFGISLLAIVLPMLFQLILGLLSIYKKVKVNFDLICLISLFSQIIFILTALKVVEIDAQKRNFDCGMAQTSLFLFGIAMVFVLILLISIQLIVRRFVNKKIYSNKSNIV